MTLKKIQLDGDAARVAVRKVWPSATSSYIGVNMSEVYDPITQTVLGRAECSEFSVEHAWIAAASIPHENPNNQFNM